MNDFEQVFSLEQRNLERTLKGRRKNGPHRLAEGLRGREEGRQ